MGANCPICLGIGWACENHPDRAWDDALGCVRRWHAVQVQHGGRAGVDEPDISQVIVEDGLTRPA
jgi:hypothetical protein